VPETPERNDSCGEKALVEFIETPERNSNEWHNAVTAELNLAFYGLCCHRNVQIEPDSPEMIS
jgi:hypothetical protein